MQTFVARQPIFDAQRSVFGYELLFRSGWQNAYDSADPDQASLRVIDASSLVFGLDELTAGRRAFINFTRRMLLEGYAALLPRELLVVEVLETVEPDAAVIAACQRLKDDGYVIALDDFSLDDAGNPLVALADVIKVDFLASNPEQRAAIIRKLGSPRLQFLAEKVETEAEFQQAVGLGYSLFQGYFFARPTVLQRASIQGSAWNNLQLLQEINSAQTDFGQLEQIVKRDASLSYKLLKYINSAFFGFGNEITSIRHALVLLGAQRLRCWTSIVVLAELGRDSPPELLATCVVRGKLCEAVAELTALRERADQLFLVGLFSSMDALLRRPLEEILRELPLADDCRRALLGEPNALRAVLDLVIAYEQSHWTSVDQLAGQIGVDTRALPDLYRESVRWADALTAVS